MKAIDKLDNILNNENVSDCFFNMYERWCDERGYEEIDPYGKVLVNMMNHHFPEYGVELVSANDYPFGVTVKIDNKKFRINVTEKGEYLSLGVLEG